MSIFKMVKMGTFTDNYVLSAEVDWFVLMPNQL